MGTLTAGQSIETVKINELSKNILDLDVTDKVPLWVQSIGKTKYIELSQLKAFVETGSGQIITPEKVGSSIFVKVSAGMDGATVFNIPSIAGQIFVLRRNGYGGMILGEDFEILADGGFRLKKTAEPYNDRLTTGEIFELQLATNIGVTPGIGSDNLFDGDVVVSSAITLNQNNHYRKLIRARSVSSIFTVTLSKIEDFPVNATIGIEAIINCAHEVTIETQAGQNIYFNGESVQKLFLKQGDSILLEVGVDGYYVLYASPRLYTIGDISDGWKLGKNQFYCIGQELSRTENAGLWTWIQTLGPSLVDDATWLTSSATVDGKTVAFPYRGCFSTGDGTGTFRLPDFSNTVIRTLKNIGGSDDQRYLNIAGIFQQAMNKIHKHTFLRGLFKRSEGIGASEFGTGGGGSTWGAKEGFTNDTDQDGGPETRMDNIGMIKKIQG